jgi:hypothetical protein
VAKRDLGVDLQEPLRLGCGRGVASDPEPLGRSPQEHRIADRLRRRDQKQPPRLGRHLSEPAPEVLLDLLGQRQRDRHSETAPQISGRQPARQLQQRQRIPARLRHDPRAHPLVQGNLQHRGQQRARIAISQTLDDELREPRQLFARFARREDQRHRLGQQAPGHKRECLRRSTIKPLRVVDDAQERLLAGRLRQQTQEREPDEESIRRVCRPQPERHAKGLALRARQPLQPIHHRCAQLLKGRERELHLPLDADRPRDTEAQRRRDRVPQQRRLAHPRLPSHDEDSALPTAHRLE